MYIIRFIQMTKDEFVRKFKRKHGEGALVIMRAIHNKTYLPMKTISKATGLSYRQTRYWLKLGINSGYFVTKWD